MSVRVARRAGMSRIDPSCIPASMRTCTSDSWPLRMAHNLPFDFTEQTAIVTGAARRT